MRLTLRTLLAFLDGILPPAAHDDLAGQLSATPIAENLVKRIRRVTARPEIPAPRSGGRGLAEDANSVAEFLDNTLSPDQLTAFEKICLESDIHLAEVASCHEMLAEVARDPAVMPPLDAATRDRLMHEVHHRAALQAVHAERQEARDNAAAVMAAMGTALAPPAGAVDGAVRPAPNASGRSQPKKPWLAWGSAALAMLVLLLAAGVLTWSVASGGRRVASRPAAEPAGRGAPATEPAKEPAKEPEPPPPAAAAAPPLAEALKGPEPAAPPPVAAAAALPRNEPVAPAATEAADVVVPAKPVPPMTAESKPPAEPAAVAVRVPAGDALAIAAPPAAMVPPPAIPPAAPPGGEEKLGVVGAGGVLLHSVLRAGRDTWVHFPAGAELAEREKLVAPPGGAPEIDVAGVVVKLLPGTLAELSIDPDGTPRITVTFGRITARGIDPEARLGITASRLHGVVTAGLAAPVAVSVELERQPGDDPAGQRARIRAALMSTTAALSWRQLPMVDRANPAGGLLAGIPPEGMMEARSTLLWDSLRPDRVTTGSRPASGWPDVPLPNDRLEQRAAETLGTALAGGRPAADVLHDMAVEPRAENRSLAAATLALLGQYDELITLLSADAPGARLEAVQWLTLEAATVPLALSRGANSAAAFRQALVERGPRGKAELLAALAKGFSDTDLAAGGDALLVEALDDPDLVVRRYAAKNLFEITRPSAADRIRYRPDGLPEMRREGTAWWRVQQEKGLVRRTATR